MINIIINNFNKIAGTILGSAFVGYVGYRTYQKTRFNQAAAEFHNAFTNVLAILPALERGDDNIIMNTLLGTSSAHYDALLKFKVFLSKSKQAKIEKAWGSYCNYEAIPGQYEPEYSDRFYKYSMESYPVLSDPDDNFEAKRKLALDSINRLLSFAKLK